MNKILNKKNILGFLILNIIPFFLIFIHIYLDLDGVFPGFKNLLLMYNYSNSGIISYFILNPLNVTFNLYFILIYNCIFIFLFQKINFFKKYYYLYLIIFSFIMSFIGLLIFSIIFSI